MSVSPVFVLGGAQTDFARNLAREGTAIDQLVGEIVDRTLADARVEASAIEAIHVGNAFGELFTGQAQLGAMPATVREAMWGLPAARHEAACASGSIAILAAMAEIEAGRYDCVLVLGVEQERNVTGEVAAAHLGAAAWVGHEGQGARYLWPHMFSRIADAYAERWGLDARHLAALGKKNLDNAKANPLAQTRAWVYSDASFAADDALNPIVEGRLRRHDCAQLTDGAAGVVLASARFAAAHASATARSIDAYARIAGWGHRTAALGLDAKLARAGRDDYLIAHVRRAILDAYRRAGLAGPEDLDGVETHDCFTPTEYLAIDHFGVTPPGQSFRAIEEGVVDRRGSLPFNPSGGLIGGGHPVGATGIRMLVDATRQVTDRAGDMQIAGARTFATLNLGGSATTAVCLIATR